MKTRDLDLALRAAKLAFETTDGNAAVADTYALALFETGKASEAVTVQKKAIEYAKDDKLRTKLEEDLKRYEAKAKN